MNAALACCLIVLAYALGVFVNERLHGPCELGRLRARAAELQAELAQLREHVGHMTHRLFEEHHGPTSHSCRPGEFCGTCWTPWPCPVQRQRDEMAAQHAQHLDVVEQISRLQGRAEAERDAALAAVQRVRELHARYSALCSDLCAVCTDTDDAHSALDWPCPTIRALDAVQP